MTLQVTSPSRRQQHFGLACSLFAWVGCGQAPPTTNPVVLGNTKSTATVAELMNLDEYQPQLGVGVNSFRTKTYRKCVTAPMTSSPTGFEKRLYVERSISSRHDLNKALDVTAAVGARGLWGDGGATAGYFSNLAVSSESLYWLVDAQYGLLNESIDTADPRFELTEAAKGLLSGPNGLADFRAACGELFYSGTRKGARYALLYEFHSSETHAMEKIRAAANFSGWGANAQGSFGSLAEMAERSSILEVYAASAGGGPELKSYPTNPVELQQQLTALREDVYAHGSGVPLEWFVSDYNMFAEVRAAQATALAAGIAPPSDDLFFQESALQRLYRAHQQAVDMEPRIRARQAQAVGPERLYRFSPGRWKALNEWQRRIDQRIEQLASCGRQCLRGSTAACSCEETESDTSWDLNAFEEALAPDEDLTGLRGWTIRLRASPESSLHLQLVGTPPGRTSEVIFYSNFSLFNSPLGVLGLARQAEEGTRIIGSTESVADPKGGQPRPNICVYGTSDVCSLRVVGLGEDLQDVKLQMVMYDDLGYIYEKIDFPAIKS